ncbi:hypothetical protein [Psychroserpens algicola]|uniref:Uncharacterized protein n=1 Tax=Psychroserpens algicola TaxID=1719034 RepID=A0ABT0HAA6_9FLAO|nr:hypothetical protein [Psychroserpens algicola]MCK8480954.1 hypothetical protein [Psychroserpens algicola]
MFENQQKGQYNIDFGKERIKPLENWPKQEHFPLNLKEYSRNVQKVIQEDIVAHVASRHYKSQPFPLTWRVLMKQEVSTKE